MRLISCRIENFGCLCDVSFDFDGGLNRICRENGAGKSTLAAFLRIMLYGFENDKSRDDYTNERRRYRPWQGGVYGGSLTFEAAGRTYTATRIFGSREKEDSFELRDAKSNVLSRDFSERLGEELFKIDSRSFVRTVFISQNDCMTSTTDGINAKLGNLAENTDDINNYRQADEGLKDILNRMSPKRSTGALYKMRSEISELSEKTRAEDTLKSSVESVTAQREERLMLREKLNTERQELAGRQRQLAAAKDKQSKLEKYKALCERSDECQSAYSNAAGVFSGEQPKLSELSDAISECAALYELRGRAEQSELSDYDKDRQNGLSRMFENGVFDDAELERQLEICRECDEKERELELKRAELAASDRTDGNEKNGKDSKNRKRDRAALILLALGAVAAIAGIIVFFTVGHIGSIFFPLACSLFLVGGAISARRAAGRKRSDADAQKARTQDGIDAIDSFIKEGRAENISFLSGFGTEAQERQLAMQLNDLKRHKADYIELCSRKKRHEEAQADCKRLNDRLCGYVRGLSFEPEENLQEQLIKIRELAGNLIRYKEQLEEAKSALDGFVRENDIARLREADGVSRDESLEELNRQSDGLAARQEELNKEISVYDKELDELSERLERISEYRARLSEMEREYSDKSRRYGLLERTRELLAAANTSFTARYMEPLTRGFEKYYNLLDASGADRDENKNKNKNENCYRIDADVNITSAEHGLQREIRFLSVGSRDLIGICMRMALADAMYSEEKPFLIFDDPFVNLDDERYGRAGLFLKELEKYYQIIYFTCRSEL